MPPLVQTETDPSLHYDPELRRYNDTTTLMAEMMNGQMRTEFIFQPIGNELYGEDGGALTPVFDDAVIDAKRAARWQPELAFQVDRVSIEREELDEIKAMASGENENTMIVVSDHPHALKGAKKDVLGYSASRQKTMLRIISRKKDGSIHMVSQSLDRSDRKALEAIYEHFGIVPEEGELLGQRIRVELPDDEQEFLPDVLTGVYDRSLTERLGGEWRAGRTPAERINTYDFVCAQDDLIEAFHRQCDAGGNREELIYQLAAALDNRFNSSSKWLRPEVIRVDKSYEVAVHEMHAAGHAYMLRGINFSGCGLTLNPGGDSKGSEEALRELGYSTAEYCPEVKDGQRVKCPGCKETVKAIVPDKESIYCSNPRCKLAHASIKE